MPRATQLPAVPRPIHWSPNSGLRSVCGVQLGMLTDTRAVAELDGATCKRCRQIAESREAWVRRVAAATERRLAQMVAEMVALGM